MSSLNILFKKIDDIQNEINGYKPFTNYELSQVKEFYRVGLIYSSTAIEGNSLTETETKIILEDGITIGGKPLKDHLEVIGHSQAFDYLLKLSKNKTMIEADILKLHHLIYYHIDDKKAGKYRKEQVFISGTEYLPPSYKELPRRMKNFTDNIVNIDKKHHPIKYAALLHKELVDIHPFIDGNGRTARLLMNLVLLQKGYVITIIPPILRNQYITAIKETQLKKKSNDIFVKFIAEMVYESQKDYLRLIKALRV